MLIFGVQEYLGFIMALNEAVQGKGLSVECPQSSAVTKTIEMLNRFDNWITEIPPTDQPQRFGNKSFRIWNKKLIEVSFFRTNLYLHLCNFYLNRVISGCCRRIETSTARRIAQSTSRSIAVPV